METVDDSSLARLVHDSALSRTEIVMADDPTDGTSFPEDRYKNPETALGGADAVEKTTYVTGKGTDPSAQKPPGEPSARVKSGGQGATWAIIAFLIVAAVLVYLLGYGR